MSSQPYKIHGELPLFIEANGSPDLDDLCLWLSEQADALKSKLSQHGAFLFRGFDVKGPEDFERVARCIAPELKNDYLGTSPRDAVTSHVFHASELPGFYPIPQHCEMSFCAKPPEYLFFSAMTAPNADCGETPLCDFRKVWQDMDEEVKARFTEKGLKIVRNYAAPDAPAGDAMQLKGWDEMFQSTNKNVVEMMCQEEGFTPVWKGDGGLQLWSTQDVFRDHPATGERAWYNHLTTFHVSTPLGEYKRIAKFRPTEQNQNFLEVTKTLDKDMRAKPPEERSMHTMYGDGSEIPDEDIEHVRDVVWQNLVVNAWQQGDIVAIDNASIAHGRLPYEGDREIVVCWS